MIQYHTGTIFSSETQCLINPVNTVGVMGAGLALEFKRRYPDMFATYRKMCREGALGAGQVAFWSSTTPGQHVICLFPTKIHYQEKSTIALIDSSLQSFVKYAPLMRIESAAFPMVGCGLGGLDFTLQVQPLMERHLRSLDMDIEIYI